VIFWLDLPDGGARTSGQGGDHHPAGLRGSRCPRQLDRFDKDVQAKITTMKKQRERTTSEEEIAKKTVV
jgi:hypothetical protein